MVRVKLILSSIMVKAKKIAIPLMLLKVLIIVIRGLWTKRRVWLPILPLFITTLCNGREVIWYTDLINKKYTEM